MLRIVKARSCSQCPCGAVDAIGRDVQCHSLYVGAWDKPVRLYKIVVSRHEVSLKPTHSNWKSASRMWVCRLRSALPSFGCWFIFCINSIISLPERCFDIASAGCFYVQNFAHGHFTLLQYFLHPWYANFHMSLFAAASSLSCAYRRGWILICVGCPLISPIFQELHNS